MSENFEHIIITSAPRSGSTPFAKFLGRQDDVFVTNEIGIYDDWGNTNKWRNFINSKEWINFVANKEIFDYHNYDLYKFRQEVIDNKMSGKDIFRWIQNKFQSKIIGDKCPITHLQNMPMFIKKFPNAKFVIILRDGRDVIASQIRGYHRWPPGDPDHASHWMFNTIEDAQHVWLDVSKLIVSNINKFNNTGRLFIFNYEDIFKYPDELLSNLSSFLNVDLTYDNFEFVPTNINSWKEEYPDMMDRLSTDFKDMLRLFDYN